MGQIIDCKKDLFIYKKILMIFIIFLTIKKNNNNKKNEINLIFILI